jgi:parallel beta-helix repeat protein
VERWTIVTVDHWRMAVKGMASLSLLLLCASSLLVTRSVAASRTWTVDPNGSADYRTIQQALDSAVDGDSIVVHSGTYYESVVVNKRVSIVGQDAVSTVIDGNGSARVVTLSAGGIALGGFTIRDGVEGVTVLSNMNNLTGNVLINNFVGLVLSSGSEGNIVSENDISLSVTYGIYGDRCGKNLIAENNVSSNGYDGIFLYQSDPCVLDHNRILSNTMDGARIRYSSNNTVEGNLFSGNDKGLVILSDEDPLRKPGLAKNNTIEENIVVNNSCGIMIEHAAVSAEMAENVIRGNLIGFNGIGLNVSGSNGNLIFNNDFVNNSKQVSLNDSLSNSWDGGYYVGGNYWSDYNGTDSRWGMDQDRTGSDGVIDLPHVVAVNPGENDTYPFARADAWLEVPEIEMISPANGTYRQYHAQEIPLTLKMNKPLWLSYSLDGESNLTVTDSLDDLPVGVHGIMLFANDTLGNEVSLGVSFTITFTEDLTLDGTVNIVDITIVAYSYGQSVGGQRWNPDADLNSDGTINILDIALVAKEYGQKI